MSFFQNVFTNEFLGSLVLGDRQYAPTFKVKPNAGRGDELVTAWNEPTYDFSGNDSDSNTKHDLEFSYSIDGSGRIWSNFKVNVASTAAVEAATTAHEVLSALEANVNFSGLFTASLGKFEKDGTYRIQIRQKMAVGRMKFYIVNGGAEEALGFNKRAGVAELPAYFARHTIAERWNFTDSFGMLIELDPSLNVDAALIDNAVDYNGISLGYAHGTVQADWQLLRGSSGLFTFKKQTVDGSNRVTQIIEYPCGAKVGDFSKKTSYTYTAANTAPSTIAEIPYVLESGDLITP